MNKLILLLKGLLLYPPLTLLIFNIILIGFLLYFYHNKKTTITRETTLSKLVESFKISNIRNTLVILLIYFIVTIGIFFILRILNIGYSKALFYISVSMPFINILTIISIILLLGLFKRIFYNDILKEMFKIYLYLLTLDRGKRFIEFLFDSYHDSKSNDYIRKIYLQLSHIQPGRELISIILDDYDINYLISKKNVYYMKNKLQQSPTLYMIAHIMYRFFSQLDTYWWALRHYSIYFVLYCAVLYDLSQEVLYYIYFILPIFMLITLYRKLRSFIGEKDFYVLDPLLIAYIYKKECSLYTLFNYEVVIREYLFNGYRGEHASDFFREKTPSIDPFFIQVKRLYILLSISITSWFLLFNMTPYNTLLLTLPLVLSFNTMEYNHVIVYNSKKLLKKIVFYISIIGMIIINIWVYLTRHHHYYLREVIWDKGIVIKQIFTIEEKKDFLYKYLNYTLDKMTTISEEIKGIILSKVRDEYILECLQEETSIQQIRTFVEYLPQVYFRLERFYNHQFVEMQHKAQIEAYIEYYYHLFDEWLTTFLILIVIVNTYFYITNKTKDIIISDNHNVTPQRLSEQIEIIIKYFKSFF